jgi:hypothetical protein
MKDDSGDLSRRGLWLASGCAALGAVLILRSIGDPPFAPGITWTMLVLGILIAPAAIETGRQNIDLPLSVVSLAASVLGLLLFVVGYFMKGGLGDFLDLGPVFALVGFATGTICNCMGLWDVFQDVKEIAKEKKQQADKAAAGLRPCPNCGKKIPIYAQACQFCRSILTE